MKEVSDLHRFYYPNGLILTLQDIRTLTADVRANELLEITDRSWLGDNSPVLIQVREIKSGSFNYILQNDENLTWRFL